MTGKAKRKRYLYTFIILIFFAILISSVIPQIRRSKENRIIRQNPPVLKAPLRSDKWIQVNGPYGGWITELEKVDNDLLAATSYTYQLGSNGIYRIANKGLKWSELGGTHRAISDLAVDPSNANNIVFVAEGGDQYSPRSAGMSISEDGGQTWRRSNKGFATNVHVSKIFVDKKNPAIVYATTQGPTNFQEKTGSGYGVFKTTNYGKSWEKIKNGLGTAETNTIAIDPADSNTLYLGTDDDGIYKSIDGGTSWRRLNIRGLPEHYGVGDIVVDPRDTNKIYVATVDYFRLFLSRGVLGDHGVYISRDGGKSWWSFNDGLTHSGAFALELDDEKGILYVGTRGGGIYWRAAK